jgi:protein arginine kinase
MINEEDHLRLQAISPGMNLPAVWDRVNALDTELESRLEYAFSPQLGYLTACPSNVGTGLRASVMMHLSGLRLTNEIQAVVKGLGKLGIAVRGLLGEGTEAHGNMFQVSNQGTLGEAEDAIIEGLIEVVAELTQHEQNARARLMEGRRTYVLDQIGRAYGVLSHARVLSSQEAIDMLSALRLGLELKLIDGLSISGLNEIMLLTQPGHLQKMAGHPLGPEERDELRASTVKRELGNVAIAK